MTTIQDRIKTLKNIFFANGVKCDSEQFLIEDINNLIKEVQEETRKEMKETTKQWYENHTTNWEVNNLVDDLFGREFLLSITNKKKQK